MGCCVSSVKSPKTDRSDVSPRFRQDQNHPPPPDSPPLEEETVKEVLSETPILKPAISKLRESVCTTVAGVKPEPEEVKIQPRYVINPAEDVVSEVSGGTEICSFSESLTGTTLSEKKEDDGEVSQRARPKLKAPRKQLSAGDFARGKEAGPRSPARRFIPSPEKRVKGATRPVQSRTTTAQRRNVAPQNGNRQSRSPATREESEPGRNSRQNNCPSSIPAGHSGVRSPVTAEGNDCRSDKPSDDVLPEAVESLENPLVSLECFIFL